MPDSISKRKHSFDPVLSANPSFGEIDLQDDQTWQIRLNHRFASGIVLESSLGSRVSTLQVFPVLLGANNLPIRITTSHFALEKLLSEQTTFRISILNDVEFYLTLRAADSHTLVGELEFKNRQKEALQIKAGALVRFHPFSSGKPMTLQQNGDQASLQGDGGLVYPTLMLSGLPEPIYKPYPGLIQIIEIDPGLSGSVTWVLATESSPKASFHSAREHLHERWKGVFLRSVMAQETDLIHFKTDDLEVDDVLSFSQVQQRRLILTQDASADFPVMVPSRQPDSGYFPGTGKKRLLELNGWEFLYAEQNFLFPSYSETAKNLFTKLLQSSTENETASGQVNRMDPPFFSYLALDIYRHTEDLTFLQTVYPALVHRFQNRIEPRENSDAGLPLAWANLSQSGWEENPLFSFTFPAGKGYPPEVVASPAMGACLHQEGRSLSQIARLLGETDRADRVQEITAHIQQAVSRMWDRKSKVYRYQDCDTHFTPEGKLFARGSGSGVFPMQRILDTPARVGMALNSTEENHRPVSIEWIGESTNQVEITEQTTVSPANWQNGKAAVVTRQPFARIASINVTGLIKQDGWEIRELDLTQIDLTCFLPLWAGIPSPEEANQMVRFNLSPNWIDQTIYGLPMLPPVSEGKDLSDPFQYVQIPIVSLLIDGLLNYGFYNEADQLVNRMLAAIIKLTKTGGEFREKYHVVEASGAGKYNPLVGLAPVGLYLRNAGISLRRPGRIDILSRPGFPHEIELRYRGFRIQRDDQKALVHFQDGQQVSIDNRESKTIIWKKAGDTE